MDVACFRVTGLLCWMLGFTLQQQRLKICKAEEVEWNQENETCREHYDGSSVPQLFPCYLKVLGRVHGYVKDIWYDHGTRIRHLLLEWHCGCW